MFAKTHSFTNYNQRIKPKAEMLLKLGHFLSYEDKKKCKQLIVNHLFMFKSLLI